MKKPEFAIVLLVGVYVALQLIADVTATKIVGIAGITLPAGTFVFALTFTWRDMIHKRLGKTWAQAAIWVAALCNVGMALYFMFAVSLPPAYFWPLQEAFADVLSIVPRIAIASIIAELISELIDTEIYHALIKRVRDRHQYLRVLGSNAVSLPIDSVIFTVLAFAGVLPAEAMLMIMLGQTVFKMAVTVVSMPLIYLIPRKEAPVKVYEPALSAAD